MIVSYYHMEKWLWRFKNSQTDLKSRVKDTTGFPLKVL